MEEKFEPTEIKIEGKLHFPSIDLEIDFIAWNDHI